MTHYCQPCNGYFSKDEVSDCTNCGRILCMDCLVDEESADERQCKCPPLCETCRGTEEDGAKCHFCEKDGCPQCLEGGCNYCNHDADGKKPQLLACDDCLGVCDTCTECICPMHLLTNKLPVLNNKYAEDVAVCVSCASKEQRVSNVRRKNKKSKQEVSSTSSAPTTK